MLYPLPEMVVRKTEREPIIDGKLSSGEWDDASAGTAFTTAFREELAKNQSTFWITYDDSFIYVAIRNYRGEHDVLLRKHARRLDDVGIVFDHSNEIWITPPGTPQSTYQTLFNSYPAVYDKKIIPSVGYVSMSWKGGLGDSVIGKSQRVDGGGKGSYQGFRTPQDRKWCEVEGTFLHRCAQ